MRITSLFICLILTGLLNAQTASDSSDGLHRSLYENALLQIQNIILTPPPSDSIVFYLMSDARQFAGDQQWLEAYEILKAALTLYEENFPSDKGEELDDDPLNSEIQARVPRDTYHPQYPRYPFQLEVGVDYSQQEFELSFLENDSAIIEELQNPYVGFLFNHNHLLANHPLSFHHRFRLDNQFIYYSMLSSYESGGSGSRNRLDMESHFYHQASQDYADFLDNQLRYTWSISQFGKRLFYVNLRGRYKWHLQQDSLSSDIFSTALNGYYEHFFNFTNSLYFNITPEYYQERQDLAFSYFQTRAGTFVRSRKSYNQYVEAGMELVYRNFTNEFSDEAYQNRYVSVEPQIRSELLFHRQWGIGFKLEYESRNYQAADEINPNFNYFSGEGLLKYYWQDFRSIGAGYFYERQSHRTEDESLKPLFEQEDFYSSGLIVNADVMNLSGFLLNFEYRLSVRTFPNAVESPFANYYSNRFIHSLSAFGWIPVGSRWQVQLFANYDNDQDRDNEHNDNRSTILNVGVVYKF